MNNSDKFALILEKLQKLDVIDDKVTALDKRVTVLDTRVTAIELGMVEFKKDMYTFKNDVSNSIYQLKKNVNVFKNDVSNNIYQLKNNVNAFKNDVSNSIYQLKNNVNVFKNDVSNNIYQLKNNVNAFKNDVSNNIYQIKKNIDVLNKKRSNNQEKEYNNVIYSKFNELYQSSKIKFINIKKFFDTNCEEITDLDGFIFITSKYPLYNYNHTIKNISIRNLRKSYKYSKKFLKKVKKISAFKTHKTHNINTLTTTDNKKKKYNNTVNIKDKIDFNFHKLFLIETKRTFDKVKLDMKLEHAYKIEQILNKAKTIDLQKTPLCFKKMFTDINPTILPNKVHLVLSTDNIDELLYKYIRDINNELIDKNKYDIYTHELLIKNDTFKSIYDDINVEENTKKELAKIYKLKNRRDINIMDETRKILNSDLLKNDKYFQNKYYVYLNSFVKPYEEVSKYYDSVKHLLGIYSDNKLFIEGVIDEFN